ncbi:MAG TPA: GNAT family N-acetyltransferase [Terriglobales bacterium]|nr:GNAT family N-acetyltransferase [Terriglobales bacterium]
MFQSYEWNRLAAQYFAGREQPFVVFCEDDNGFALVPAAIADGGGRIVLLGESLFDYRDVLAEGDPDTLTRAWQKLAELCLPLSVLNLRGVETSRRWANFSPIDFCHAPGILRRDTSSEVIERGHRRLGRFSRRLERAGACFRRYDGSASTLVREIYRKKSQQFHGAGNNVFADERRIDFMISAAAQDPNACEIFTHETETCLVAALVTFRDRGVRRFYTVYHDPAWAKASPGQVLIYEVTRNSLDEGLDCDYMTGEQSHKMRLATLLVPLYRVDLSAEQLRTAVFEQVTVSQIAA